MKKVLAFIFAALMCVSLFAGCAEQKEDWAYIEDKGELIIGITLFAPMNYKDADGELTGFETEFAKAVCEELGLKAKFQVIEWSAKETELNSKNIDCIWNGMTIDDDRRANMAISVPYMKNQQVMVVRQENADKYTDAASLKDAVVVAEKKSAGETVAQKNETFAQAKYTAVDSQAKVLLEVKAGTADVGLIDYVMSIGSLGEGTDYADLTVTDQTFNPEEYGIAFRKGSTETLEKVNAAIQKLADNGTLQNIAKKYKLDELLLVKAK